ncbi:MAG: class I SAM-dependent methyltransferase [Actinomycetota bacterium]|nr:class I SAM-dependent methyltransferase [Actinomycetota bacterium]
MLNWLLRYQPVLDVLSDDNATTVLDVGSGWYGLSWYWPSTVVQTDLAFNGPKPSERRPGKSLYVRSTAEQLPFSDGAFDVVVSIDMVEHLPVALREASLQELLRVGRRTVVIAFPCGNTASRVDRALARALALTPGRSRPEWLQEHLAQLQYPDEGLIARTLPAGWGIELELGLGNAWIQGLVVYLEELPLIRGCLRALERRFGRLGVPAIFNSGRTYRRLYVVRRRA